MAKKAILLANLGSPDSPRVADVKTYLSEFLMDERVIDIPEWIRTPLVKGLIVPIRSPKSAEKYASIWTEEGSPLVAVTRQVTTLLEKETGIPTYMCMRYANPAATDVMAAIHADHPDLEELTLIPLYPHYAMSSFETAVEDVKNVHQVGRYPFRLHIVPPYYRDPAYIHALAETIRPYLEQPYDHLLFSYHGIPERHLRKTDPTRAHCLAVKDCCNTPSAVHEVCYRHQVIETVRAVADLLDLPKSKYSFSFQSRLGSDRWLQPYTAKEFKEMPGRGIKNLVVVCPAFVSDCLETLEEIQIEGKEDFEAAGGEHFTAIPCLNTHPLWIRALSGLVNAVEA